MVALVACWGGDPPPQTPSPEIVPTVEEAVPGPGDSDDPDYPHDMQATAPSPLSVPFISEVEAAARKLLAYELEVDESGFKLDSSEGVGWSDASLGCPQEGMAYAQVITPGYKLIFDLAGTSYAVHTNSDGSHMVICEDGQ